LFINDRQLSEAVFTSAIFMGWMWRTYSKEDLERIIYEPLGARERSNHDDSRTKAVKKPLEANLRVDTADGLHGALASLTITVQFRHHNI
jgi:hypothetical protein